MTRPVHRFTRAGLLFAALALGWAPSGIAFQPGRTSVQARAQALLDAAVQNQTVAGISAGLMVDGRLVWVGGAGYGDVVSQSPFGPATLARIASISKPMTAVAVMQLVEQGKIDLDAPLQAYIPDFPKKKEGTVTVRRLLSHTAGIPGFGSDKETENRRQYTSLTEASKVFVKRRLLGEPGKIFYYTSYGYVLLGLVVENVGGMSYEAYMDKHIWGPVGMVHTGPELFGKDYLGKAALYHRDRQGAVRPAKPNNLSDRVPGGGLQSTVADVLQFGNAVASNSLIQESTLRTMLVDPATIPLGNGYGLGWHLYGTDPEYGPVFGHTGAQTGVSAILLVVPQRKITVAVLSNTSGAGTKVAQIAESLFEIAVSGS